jgi:hypothetical protein
MSLRTYVKDQIWLCEYPVRLAGTKFDARMTVVRLSSGELMLHSPCNITAAIAEEILALGPVGHIVAPGNFHHMYVAAAQAAFPEARTWLCPGIECRRPGLKYDGLLGDVAPQSGPVKSIRYWCKALASCVRSRCFTALAAR